VERARLELEEWRWRYQELSEFAAVFDVIDKNPAAPEWCSRI
jgi:hypothetical protein